MLNQDLSRRELLYLSTVVEGGLGLLAAGLIWLAGIEPKVELDAHATVLGIAACVPMLGVFFVLIRWPVGPLRSLQAFTDEVVRPLFRSCTPADLAWISLLAGVGEELLFRGFVQPFLAQYLETWLALSLAAVLFGLLHPISWIYVIFAALFGVYLGGLLLVTDNLLVPIVCHGLYDFTALWWLVRRS